MVVAWADFRGLDYDNITLPTLLSGCPLNSCIWFLPLDVGCCYGQVGKIRKREIRAGDAADTEIY